MIIAEALATVWPELTNLDFWVCYAICVALGADGNRDRPGVRQVSKNEQRSRRLFCDGLSLEYFGPHKRNFMEGTKILLVDDDAIVRSTLCELLGQQGFNVTRLPSD